MSDQSVTVGGGSVALRRPAARTGYAGGVPSEVLTPARLAWFSYAGLIVLGAFAVLCSGKTAVLRPDTIQGGLPSMLAGPLAGIGPNIHLGGVIALFTMMCLFYLLLVRHGTLLPLTAIAAGILILHVLLALGPPLMSTDIFSYGEYGRMSRLYHINPYVNGPGSVSFDRWYPFVGSPWVTTPTAYGPVFTAISWLLAHLSIRMAVLAYQLITIAASLATIGGVAKAAQKMGRHVGQATILIGFNPVLILYAVGGAHNDMLMLAALVWAIVALVAQRTRTAGGLLVAGIAVKLTAGIMLPFALAAPREPAAARTRPGGHQWRLLAGAVLVLLGVVIISTILFGSGPLHLLSTLEVIQANGGRQSVPGFIAWGLGLGRLAHGVVIALQAVLVATVVGLIVAVRRRRIDWITATGWAIVALLVTSTFMLPWYVVWLLPFAALSDSRALRTTMLALTAVGLTSL